MITVAFSLIKIYGEINLSDYIMGFFIKKSVRALESDFLSLFPGFAIH